MTEVKEAVTANEEVVTEAKLKKSLKTKFYLRLKLK